MKKKPRGYSAQLVCNKNKLAVVKWSDNKVVTFISSYIDSYPIEKIKRYSKESKSKVDVACPQVVKEYNKYMGGVDLADMLISLYRTPLKSRRWYLGIFAQLLDMCINNAWLLYRRDNRPKISLKDFRYDVYESLRASGRIIEQPGDLVDIANVRKIQKPKPVTNRPVDSVRFDNLGHFPDIQEK
ncbi:hypothetical protein HF086_009095 [Spodoptera exigua]|uniref:PiggyBac transposable element-derived protein domain-containing protein n=1 Tax=Spodoptera exigua TaxID=7107 RepID=A0A922MMV3_SPOEX|nr:hypothetical protein HF086_009095 [Spodoptera exigua]